MPAPLQSQISLAAMVTIAAAPLLLLTSLVPRPLVLPALCLVVIAGGLAFIACACAILSNPRDVIALTM